MFPFQFDERYDLEQLKKIMGVYSLLM